MSEKTNDSELKKLYELRQMYQDRINSELNWDKENKDKSLMINYQKMLDTVNEKIAELE